MFAGKQLLITTEDLPPLLGDHSITAAFSTPRRWRFFPWAIKSITGSKVSHCMYGVEIHGIQMFLHCGARGVDLVPRKKFEQDNVIIYEFQMLPNVQQELAEAYKKLSDAYDFAGIVGFAWVKVMFRLFRRRTRNPLASAKAMWCSEFLLHANAGGKLPEWDGLEPELTDPQQLIDRIEERSPADSSFRAIIRPGSPAPRK